MNAPDPTRKATRVAQLREMDWMCTLSVTNVGGAEEVWMSVDASQVVQFGAPNLEIGGERRAMFDAAERIVDAWDFSELSPPERMQGLFAVEQRALDAAHAQIVANS